MSGQSASNDVSIHVVRAGDGGLLAEVAPEVFDEPVNADLLERFLHDPRHHLVVAVQDGVVVGFASGTELFHPDKPPQLFVNEVGVAPPWQRRGIARRLVTALLDEARAAGCVEAWVGTELSNRPARALYQSTGGDDDEAEPFVIYAWELEAGG